MIERDMYLKRILLGLMLLFLASCLVSTLVSQQGIATQITDELLNNQDTTQLYGIFTELSMSMAGVLVALKLVTMAGCFFISSWLLVKHKTASRNNFKYVLISGLIVSTNLVSFERNSVFSIFYRKLYFSNVYGITTYPLVLYYGAILAMALIMAVMLMRELKISSMNSK